MFDFIAFLTFTYLFCMRMGIFMTWYASGGQRTACRNCFSLLSSYLLSCDFQGWNSDCRTWLKVPLPTELSLSVQNEARNWSFSIFIFFELVKINLNCNNLFPVLEDTHGSLSLMGVSPSTDKLLSWHHPCKDLISTWTACDIKHVHKGRIIFYWQSVSTIEKDAS